MKLLECCVDSVESAEIATNAGADRLELCANLTIGGTSPSIALLEAVKSKVRIPVRVLLRPRFGDFLYSDAEFSLLLREAELYRDAGADGLVVGCLTAEGKLDRPRMERLIKAGGLPATLHRAFDVCAALPHLGRGGSLRNRHHPYLGRGKYRGPRESPDLPLGRSGPKSGRPSRRRGGR